jgi:hypothetical protein
MLWLRAIRANGDLTAYWDHHTKHQKPHPCAIVPAGWVGGST